MKKLALALLMILCVTCVFCACDFIEETYKITTESSRYTVTVGDMVDFKAYFTITNDAGENITVTDEMISAPDADFTKVGSFLVTCTYQDASKSIIISVENKQSPHTHNFADATCTTPKTCTCGATEGEPLGHNEKVVDATPANCTQTGLTQGKICSVCNEVLDAQQSIPASGHTQPNAQGKCETCGEQLEPYPDGTTPNLAEIFAKYNEYTKWNFAVKFDVAVNNASLAKDYAYTYVYNYDGENFYYHDVGISFCDYIIYSTDDVYYYFDNEDGTHTLLTANDDGFYDLYPYLDFVELTTLADYVFVANGNRFSAESPNTVGTEVIGDYDNCVYTSFDLYITNGYITKIVATQQDYDFDAIFTYTLEFYNYGNITVDTSKLVVDGTTPPDQGDDNPSIDGDTMPEQSFDKNNHVDYDDILYDAIIDYDNKNNYLPSTGLPSQGKYDVLVIPVEFSNDTFTAQELADLGKVLNDQSATGWHSVASYYKASSYGKLDLAFDIADKITLNQTYQSFDKENYFGEKDYGQSILKQALDKLDARGFDFSKYDYDNNGVIDGVYIIYSAPIDYDTSDYFWAYVTAYMGDDDTEYDGLLAYTYLFASIDFVYEDIETSDPDKFSPIAGLKLNATTYIHETGHMLGLDDYYDYAPSQGSDQGLGGADMMDYTAGDHNAYSKLLLGWVKPTVVTSTQTVTINPLESSGQFVIVLLDYDGTYFSEYLIIDLYSATGLNQMHANVEGSYLYDGASFGARIYHVDSTIKTPYNQNDAYGSFTDNNNSTTKHPLLKLVEADGDKNFESETEFYQGEYYTYAGADDLWQTGDVFGSVHPNYTRHDGKKVNFDISFDSVTATSATITITFDYE